MPNFTIPNPATQQDINNIVLSILLNLPIIPQSVSVVSAAPASTTYTYVVVAKQNGQVYPVSTTITTGAAALSTAAANTIAWSAFVPAIPPPSTSSSSVLYDVYRTTGGTTQGKIASNINPQQLGPLNAAQAAADGNLPVGISYNSGSSNPLTVVDNGIAGDGTTAPAFSTVGTLGVGTIEPLQVISAAGAITQNVGNVLITGNSTLAITLAQPIAGPPSAGGQDGSKLTIIETGTGAHTVTTASNGISPSHHVLTFGGTAFDSVTLLAYNGVWYPISTNGVTAS